MRLSVVLLTVSLGIVLASKPRPPRADGEGDGEHLRDLDCHYPIYDESLDFPLFAREICNLNSPRGISFASDLNYFVAESGMGGNFDRFNPLNDPETRWNHRVRRAVSAPPSYHRNHPFHTEQTDGSVPVTAGEDGDNGFQFCGVDPDTHANVCGGNTAAVVQKIYGESAKRVVTGLPSTGNVGSCNVGDPGYQANGREAIGLDDVHVGHDGKIFGIITHSTFVDNQLDGHLVQFSGLFTSQEGGDDKTIAQSLKALLARKRNGRTVGIANIAEWQSTSGNLRDHTDPYSVLELPNGEVWVADSGVNNVVRVDKYGMVSKVADIPGGFASCGIGLSIPYDAVPNCLAYDPNDADFSVYVGMLSGFPFEIGDAKVYKITRHRGDPSYQPFFKFDEGEGEVGSERLGDRVPRIVEPGSTALDTFTFDVYAQGFTNIIDITFDDFGNLFVLEITSNGYLDGCSIILGTAGSPPPTTCDQPVIPEWWDFCNPYFTHLLGSVKVVTPSGEVITVIGLPHCGTEEGDPTVITQEPLIAPTGIAWRNGNLYISNRGIFPGVGEVVRFPVPSQFQGLP